MSNTLSVRRLRIGVAAVAACDYLRSTQQFKFVDAR